MKAFQEEEFIAWLKEKEKTRPVDQFLEKRVALYRQFVRGANFGGWWSLRHSEALAQLELAYVKVIDTLPAAAAARGKDELLKVDLYIRCRDLLQVRGCCCMRACLCHLLTVRVRAHRG